MGGVGANTTKESPSLFEPQKSKPEVTSNAAKDPRESVEEESLNERGLEGEKA